QVLTSDTMGRVRIAAEKSVTSKGEQTRRAILDAAVGRFGRDGYRATSVADVARDAGVGGTVAYAYFPNKEALFLAAVDEDAAGAIHQGLAAVFADPDNSDWRRTLVFTMVGAVEHHPLARRLLGGLEPEVTARVLDIPALAELRKPAQNTSATTSLPARCAPTSTPPRLATGSSPSSCRC
ncbi:MAG: TetR/AcrR family transcriptional regulator, partial [Actinomycetota bacterium]|nr:TetR/AcrR family transcriptional regulator [Actinomycetota bacterium]